MNWIMLLKGVKLIYDVMSSNNHLLTYIQLPTNHLYHSKHYLHHLITCPLATSYLHVLLVQCVADLISRPMPKKDKMNLIFHWIWSSNDIIRQVICDDKSSLCQELKFDFCSGSRPRVEDKAWCKYLAKRLDILLLLLL